MPLYSYECNLCFKNEERLTTYAERNSQTCKVCGNAMVFKPTNRFNATNLPNGFSSTRNGTRRPE